MPQRGINLEVRVDTRQVNAVLDQLRSPRAKARAQNSAINRTITSARAPIARTIRDQVGLKDLKWLRQNLKAERSRLSTLTGAIIGFGVRIPIQMLSNANVTDTGDGVRFRTKLETQHVKQGFSGRDPWTSTVSTSKQGYFVRKGRSRLPIRRIRTHSVGESMEDGRPVRKEFTDAVDRVYLPRLRHEVNRMIQRAKAKHRGRR